MCEALELGWPGSVNARDGRGYTPLMSASFRGHDGVVRALLAAGADVNAASEEGYTALIWTSYFGRESCAQLLVAAGATVDARSKRGLAPINFARGHGGATASPAIEALLLAAGATAALVFDDRGLFSERDPNRT